MALTRDSKLLLKASIKPRYVDEFSLELHALPAFEGGIGKY